MSTKQLVNPKHLMWKLPPENQLDRRKHGTATKAGGRWRLTPEQVKEIRAREGAESVRATAKRFGVTESNIRQIYKRTIWRTGRYEAGGFAAHS